MNEALLNQYKTAKEQVDYILMRYPSSRENDFALLWYWLKTFGKLSLPFLPQTIMEQLNGKPETLRRVRQKIQNEEKRWLPDQKAFVERYEKAHEVREVINFV